MTAIDYIASLPTQQQKLDLLTHKGKTGTDPETGEEIEETVEVLDMTTALIILDIIEHVKAIEETLKTIGKAGEP